MKKIFISEKQELNLIKAYLNESQGVNNDMLRVSEAMTKEIVYKAIPEILSTSYYVERWSEDYDAEYEGEVDGYKYYIFFDENASGLLKGEWEDSVRLNWRFIESIFLEQEERIVVNDNYDSWYDEEDEDETEEFDVNYYLQEALQEYEWQKFDLFQKIQPVILHELTHGLNQDANPMNRLWIKSVSRYDEEDVRDIMYIYSESEMNSRIASSANIMHNALRFDTSDRDKTQYRTDNKYFMEFMNKYVFSNEGELHLKHMETLLSPLERGVREQEELKAWCDRNGEEYDPTSLQQQMQHVLKDSLPYDIFYSLAINEGGLYKNKKPSTVKQIYIQDPQGFRERVLNFYKGKLNKYKQKIIRTCWEVWTNSDKYNWDIDENEPW